MRGLAALSVMFGHSATVLPAFATGTRGDGVTALNLLKYTPLNLLISGSAAVMVFFVLSGFVLTLPMLANGGDSYSAFLIRRFCRLWIPYAAAVVLAVVASLAFIGDTNAGLSEWFNTKWMHEPGLESIVAHVALIPSFHNDAFDPVIWSLVHEMRISLVFPLLAAAVLAFGPLRSLGAALALATVCYVIGSSVITGTDYFRTGEYVLCFVVGILLAGHRRSLQERLVATGPRVRAVLWIVAAVALSWRDVIPAGPLPGPLERLAHLDLVDVIVNTIGAALVIVLVQDGAAKRLLRRSVPQFFGRISYSLYLVHAVVLLGVLHLIGETDRPALAFPIVWALSVALATLGQRYVELPAQQLGRRLSRRQPVGAPYPAEA